MEWRAVVFRARDNIGYSHDLGFIRAVHEPPLQGIIIF